MRSQISRKPRFQGVHHPAWSPKLCAAPLSPAAGETPLEEALTWDASLQLGLVSRLLFGPEGEHSVFQAE